MGSGRWNKGELKNKFVVYDTTKGFFSTTNPDIQAFINKYDLPKGELATLSSTLMTKYGNKTIYGDVVQTANYEYTVNYKGAGEFDIIEYHQIDNNSKGRINDKERRRVSGSFDRLSARDEFTESKYPISDYNVTDGETIGDNANLVKATSQGESKQVKSDVSSRQHQEWSEVKRDSATGRISFGTTLLDNGEGTMYLLDHTDREDIENRNLEKEDGFNCRLKFSTEGLSNEFINKTKEEIENGIIRDQKTINRRIKDCLKRQGSYDSNSIDAEDRLANADNVGLDSEAQLGESRRGQSDKNSPENLGTGFIRVYENDGTNGSRYIPINSKDGIEKFQTPQGELYGFVDGKMYLGETVVSPEHPIHEYTHLWNRAVRKKNPELWNRCCLCGH